MTLGMVLLLADWFMTVTETVIIFIKVLRVLLDNEADSSGTSEVGGCQVVQPTVRQM